MTTNAILSVFFLIEFGIVASALSVYLFLQLKKLKSKLAEQLAAAADSENAPTLHDLFEQQIARTRKKIAEKFSDQSEEQHERERSLLTRRIDFLQLEKDVLDEHVTDQSYWDKITSRLAELLSPSTAEDKEPAADGEPDNARYLERIANYQAQLQALHEEFDNYRKYSHKLSSALSDVNKEAEADKALMELMADFKAHDERLQQRLAQLQRENTALSHNLDAAEKAAFAHDYRSGKHSLHTGNTESPTTASEEEIGRLRDIIDRQYASIDDLKKAIVDTQEDHEQAHKLDDKLAAVSRSQQEMQTCIDVLEMENQRLIDELSELRAAAQSSPEASAAGTDELYELRLNSKALQDENVALTEQLESKAADLDNLQKEYDSLQEEFMHLYSKEG